MIWLLALLTALIASFAVIARTEALQGHQLRAGTQARYAAQAGIEYAALKLMESDAGSRWSPDGRPYRLPFEGARVTIRAVDESGKVDLNAADAEILWRLLVAAGAEERRARAIAGAILDWRDPDDLLQPTGGAEDPQYEDAELRYGAKDAPFDTVAEVQQVLGMDYALYRRSAPHLTVFTGMSRPNPAFAQPIVLQALGMDAAGVEDLVAQRERWDPELGRGDAPMGPEGEPLAAQGTGTYSIESTATLPDGTIALVSATVRVGVTGTLGQLYVPLQWRLGEVY